MFKTLVVKSVNKAVHTTTEIPLDFIITDTQLELVVNGVLKNGLYIETNYGTFTKTSSIRRPIVVSTKYIHPEDIVSVEVKK